MQEDLLDGYIRSSSEDEGSQPESESRESSEQVKWQPAKLAAKSQFDKYDAQFNFFFSKPVSDICEGIDTPDTKLLKELSYYDSDNQFLKRFYTMEEIPERVELLFGIHHSPQMWAHETATILNNEGRRCVLKRIRRQKKLCRMLQQIEQDEHQAFSSRFLSDQDGRSSGGSLLSKPMRNLDDSIHDIYKQQAEQQENKAHSELIQQLTSSYRHILVSSEEPDEWGLADGPSHLTVDFNDVDQKGILKQYNRLQDRKKEKDKKSNQAESQNGSFNTLAQNSTIPFRPYSPVHHQNIPPKAKDYQSPTKRVEKLLALRSLKKKLAQSNKEAPISVQTTSPRLSYLSKYSKGVVEKSYKQIQQIKQQNRLFRLLNISEQENYLLDLDERMQKALSRSPETKLYNHTQQPRTYEHRYDKGAAERSSGYQLSSFQSPSQQLNSNSQSSQSGLTIGGQRPQFEQIRRKAMELIKQPRHYPTGRVSSPRTEFYSRRNLH